MIGSLRQIPGFLDRLPTESLELVDFDQLSTASLEIRNSAQAVGGCSMVALLQGKSFWGGGEAIGLTWWATCSQCPGGDLGVEVEGMEGLGEGLNMAQEVRR